MMMDAEMYGMMPSEKMHAFDRLPPENSDTNPSTWPSAPPAGLGHLLGHLGLVDHRQRDVVADAVDGEEDRA